MSAAGLPDDDERPQRRRRPASELTSRGQEDTDDEDRYASSHISDRKERFSVDVDAPLGEEFRDLVHYAQREVDPRITLTSMLSRGMELVIAEKREQYGLEEIPPREGGELRPGPPPR